MTTLETVPQRLVPENGERPTTQVLFAEARERHHRRLTWIGSGVLLLVASLTSVLVTTSATQHRAPADSTVPTRVVPTCPVSNLRTSFDGANSGLAGSIVTGFQLENVGASSCAIQGHPTAIFRDGGGAVKDITVGHMGSIVHGRTVTSSPRIVLRPGGRAYADMIVPNCVFTSPGPLASVQLVFNGEPVPGVVAAGRGAGKPYVIGGVCRSGDPGTHVAVSQLEPTPNLI